MRRSIPLLPLTCAAAWYAGASPIYTITDLGAGPGTGGSAYALAISSDGRVSGQYLTSSFAVGAFAWNSGTATYVSGVTAFTGINSSGNASATTVQTPQHWDGSTVSNLPLATSTVCCGANGINDSGDIAGQTHHSSGVVRATVWSGGVHSYLPLMSGFVGSSAQAINSSGDVAGWSIDNVADQATVWTGGVGQLLPLPPGLVATRAVSISDDGRAAGMGFDSSGASLPYYWSGGTATQVASSGSANGVNSSGQVVGRTSNSGGSYAFIWKSGVLQDLNSLVTNGAGWTLITATAINDSGQIVGWGTFGGQTHAYLLTPDSPVGGEVPEPGSLLLVSAGLAALGARRARRG